MLYVTINCDSQQAVPESTQFEKYGYVFHETKTGTAGHRSNTRSAFAFVHPCAKNRLQNPKTTALNFPNGAFLAGNN
jgi:hypothetical protein